MTERHQGCSQHKLHLILGKSCKIPGSTQSVPHLKEMPNCNHPIGSASPEMDHTFLVLPVAALGMSGVMYHQWHWQFT